MGLLIGVVAIVFGLFALTAYLEGKNWKKALLIAFIGLITVFLIPIIPRQYDAYLKKEKNEKLYDLAKREFDSNFPFQDLVTTIEGSLVGEDTKVKLNEPLKDEITGEFVRIPILLKSNMGVHTLRIAVEPIEAQTLMRDDFIDEILGKYSTLDVNQIVLVGASTFSEKSKKKAEAHGIDLLAIQNTTEVDWNSKIKKLKDIKFRHTTYLGLKGATLYVRNKKDMFSEKFKVGESKFRLPDGTVMKASDWVFKSMMSKPIMNMLEKRAREDGRYTLVANIPLEKGFCVLLSDNSCIEIGRIGLKGKYQIEIETKEFVKAQYGNSQIAYIQNKKYRHVLTAVFSEQEGKPAHVGFKIRKLKKDDKMDTISIEPSEGVN